MSIKTKRLFFDAFASRRQPTYTQILEPDVCHYDKDEVHNLLSKRTVNELTTRDIESVLTDNLWMLSPTTYLYYMPAFLDFSLSSYKAVNIFAGQLIASLTRPAPVDLERTLAGLNNTVSESVLTPTIKNSLRNQQIELANSGWIENMFHDRFDNVSKVEGKAILYFLDTFEENYGRDYPFNELEEAIERHWKIYRSEN